MNQFINDKGVIDPIHYMQMMGSVSHTYGNAVAYIQKWLEDIFPQGLFKTFHVNSKIAHRQLRSTNHEYLKKQKPMMVLRPRIDYDEDRFLQGTPIINRIHLSFNNNGMNDLQPFFYDADNRIAMKYQLNRTIMYVDVILIFSTMMQQMNYINYFKNCVPIGIPFDLQTCFESYLSQPMMNAISKLSGVDLFDENKSTKHFLDYMNSHTTCPVTYKIQGSTQTHEFYRYYPVKIDTLISSLNADDGEKVGQVMDNFQVSFTIRMEFYNTGFYYLYADSNLLDNLPKMDVENDSVIIPIYTDVIEKKDLQLDAGWSVYNRVTIQLSEKNDSLDIYSLLSPAIWQCINYHLDNGIPMDELIKVKIRKQGREIENGKDFQILYNEKRIQFYNSDFGYYSYSILFCVNVLYMNTLVEDVYDLK